MKRIDPVWAGLLAVALYAAGSAVAAVDHPVAPDERVFLEDLPIVLSASRLEQPLADTPGAVTVIDRELIRASGAREIVDLLRLVPGFQVGMAYYSTPAVAYHGLADEYSRQVLVRIDGRSVYSPFFLGSVPWNNLGLTLDDIERIEVQRGPNSAAYGANAFMGVINIVTRHASQSHGAHLSVTHGNQGIRDQVLRYGGQLGGLHYRLTAGRRSDDGFADFHDGRSIGHFSFRGDLAPTASDQLQLHAEGYQSDNDKGFFGRPSDPPRSQHERGHALQVLWRRALGPDEELSINAYHMADAARERYREQGTLLVPPQPPCLLSADVNADRRLWRSHLELQHILRLAPQARLVWGLEERHEAVESRQLFNTGARQSIRLHRLFGNLEWRLDRMWLLNAGAMWEKHSFAGADLAPRLMLNFQPAKGQTLRLGSTTAYRTPSLAEERARIVYTASITPPPPPPFPATLTRTTYFALGGLQPERIRSNELSYLGEFASLALTVDARVFRDHVTRIIDTQRLNWMLPDRPDNFANRWEARLRGAEYQLRWTPSADTLVLINQSRLRIASEDERVADSAPRRSTTLFLSHRLPNGLQASLAHHWTGGFRWLGWADALPMQRRLDLRLAYPFRSGPLKGEFALVAQNVKGPHSEFRTDYVFERRSFATLSLEY